MKGYFHLWRDHPQVLSFGILLTLFSSFGQTFLISIYVPRILRDFDLTEGSFGTLYAAATVCSALCLPLFGRLLDRMRLGVYSVSAGLGLSLACLTMALADSVPVLFAAILGLRLTGQGLMSLTASTAMARSFETTRGKALSVSGLGYPLGEGLLPMAMVLLIGAVGWRWSWGVLAGSVVLILLPCLIGLVRHVPDLEVRGCELGESAEGKKRAAKPAVPVLWRDRDFLLLLPGVLFPGFLVTGVFLYQTRLAEFQGWSAVTIAQGFVAFAAMRIVGSLVVGPWIDAKGAAKVFPFHLIPLVGGLALLLMARGDWVAFLFLPCAGATLGGSSAILTALWSERYGLAALGAIKSAVAMTGVMATAASPLLFGALLDMGIGFGAIIAGSLALGLVAILCARFVLVRWARE